MFCVNYRHPDRPGGELCIHVSLAIHIIFWAGSSNFKQKSK